MNYRHIYHAGSFADVVKHIVLISLLQKLKLKDKPFAVLDAFAGLGLYDLDAEEAKRTGESMNGIRKLLEADLKNTPELIKMYLDIVKKYDKFYPGSPSIVSSLLRESDRLIACELHKEDYVTLKRNMSYERNTHIHHIDAYQAIKAFWPPQEKRGLILLDPPFEVMNEFERVLKAMNTICQRFASGMVMLWYPIKNDRDIKNFYEEYKAIGYKESLVLEFGIAKLGDTAMHKCGILISNPPDISQLLEDTMMYLAQTVYANSAGYKIQLI